MAKGGVKRASPGADEEKNPLSNVDLTEEDAKNLAKAQRDLGRVELAMGSYLNSTAWTLLAKTTLHRPSQPNQNYPGTGEAP